MSIDLATRADRPVQATRKQMAAKDSLAITMWKERVLALRQETWKITTVSKEQGAGRLFIRVFQQTKARNTRELIAGGSRLPSQSVRKTKKQSKQSKANNGQPSGSRSIFVARSRCQQSCSSRDLSNSPLKIQSFRARPPV
jgi:hypothetical protein